VEDNRNGSQQSQEEEARVYNRLKRRISYAEMGLGLAFLIVLLVTGLTFFFRDIAVGLAPHPFWHVLIYFLILAGIFELITLPLTIYSGFVVERRFDLLRQSGAAWVWDYVKGILLSLVLGGLAVELLYLLMRLAGNWWWLPAGVAFALCFVLLAQLTPVLILPLFFKFKPLADEDLSARLTALCERTGARVRGIYEWGLSSKTRRVNAALVGWGPTRRVILSDNLVKDFASLEVEVILAHELGHQRLRHMPQLLMVQIALTFIAFALADLIFRALGSTLGLKVLDDVAGLPLLVLVFALVGLLALPLVNLLSRRLEQAADRFALKSTGLSDHFISAMERLSSLNLSESDPHPVIEFLFLSHPSPARRIQAARDFLSDEQGRVG